MTRRVPLKTLHVYVLVSVAVFFFVQSLKFFSVPAPDWIFHYLNDFLVIPIVATFGLHVVWLAKKDTSLRINPFTILSLVILYSLFFEFYLPTTSTRYTGDIYDVLCYGLGGIIFYILQYFK